MNTVTNANVGKKFSIPLGSSATPQPTPAATATSNRMMQQASAVASSASFAPVKPPAIPSSSRKRWEKTMQKCVYFDLDIYQHLQEMQESGQNVSRLINSLVRKGLGL